jgi:hypothetical protein
MRNFQTESQPANIVRERYRRQRSLSDPNHAQSSFTKFAI